VEPVAAAVEEVVASGAQDTAAPAAAAVEEAVAAGAQEEEAPAEGGLVDIASILGAPAVTIVRSNL
jgi:predicted secreted protein